MSKEEIALFRFRCIESLIHLARGEVEYHLHELANKSVEAPSSRLYKLNRATLLRWLQSYRQFGMEGLKPKIRKDKGQTKKMSSETAQALLRLKQESPKLTLASLIYQARLRKIIAPGEHLPRVSVYRLLKRHGLMKKEDPPKVDRLRFEAACPLDLVQADVMHGPRIGTKKAFLFAMIDDHSRLIVYAEFRYRESVEDFIAVLKQALRRRGLPRRIYVDNGPTFRSTRLSYALASLGVSLIHATPYQPEGKGKCERWFRTVRENFLPQLSLMDLENLGSLNTALWAWMDGYYHQSIHSATGQAPLERYIQNLHAIRSAPENLESVFRYRLLRLVGKDRAISLNGRAYQAPAGTMGKRLELRFDPDHLDEIEAFDQNKSLGVLKPMLIHSNAKIKRNKTRELDIDTTDSKVTAHSGKVPFPSTNGRK